VTRVILPSILACDEGPVAEVINPSGSADIWLVCEHASPAIPPSLNNPGLAAGDRLSHAAWDIGALELTRALARAVVARVSRLVYDCSRPSDAPDAMTEMSENILVAGNLNLSEAERAARITEDYTVGWVDVTNYVLTNNTSGTWIGPCIANMDRWYELPEDLQTLFPVCCEQSHYYRQHCYWGGEANLRVNGTKMQLTTIPDEEWATAKSDARAFWDEIAAESPKKAKVVEIFKKYTADMEAAGRSYRYT
jgi:hypothetical protein